MTPSMRRSRQLAVAAGVLLALGDPARRIRSDARRRGERGTAELHARRRARDPAEVRGLSSRGRHRPVPVRDVATDLVSLGADRRDGAGRPHAAVAAWPSLPEPMPESRSAGSATASGRRSSPGPTREAASTARPASLFPRSRAQVEPGESLLTLRMPSAYKPRAPKGVTDDYRCFLLDPKRAGDSFVTSARIEPGADKVVHHVILFRVAKAQVADAKRLDSRSAGSRVELLRRNGASRRLRLRRDPGLAERCELGRRVGAGLGRQSPPRRHWRAAAGRKPDRDAGALQPAERAHPRPLARAAHGRARRGEAHAAPDDAPARSGRAGLRTRRARKAVHPERGALRPHAQVRAAGRFRSRGPPDPLPRERGESRARARPPPATAGSPSRRRSTSPRATCTCSAPRSGSSSTRERRAPGCCSTSRAGTSTGRTRTRSRGRVEADAGDVVRVTCRHDVHKRMHGGHGIPKTPRYILWGEGTTDEMCLGILQVTRG